MSTFVFSKFNEYTQSQERMAWCDVELSLYLIFTFSESYSSVGPFTTDSGELTIIGQMIQAMLLTSKSYKIFNNSRNINVSKLRCPHSLF